MFAPNHQQPRLPFAHPRLPLGVGVDVRAVVIEEVALNVGMAGLDEKGNFIGPVIRVIAFPVGVVAEVVRPRRLQRQEIRVERVFVVRAIRVGNRDSLCSCVVFILSSASPVVSTTHRPVGEHRQLFAPWRPSPLTLASCATPSFP